MCKMTLAVLCVVGLALGLAGAAQAGTILVGDPLIPPGLGLGQTFHLAFATSTSTQAYSSDIAYYNAFVQGVADSAGSIVKGHGITWYAIAATASKSANTNAFVSAPVYRLNDFACVATGYSDLWDGSIPYAIQYNEGGTLRGNYSVYVGCWPNGDLEVGATLGSGNNRTGLVEGTGGGWIRHGAEGNASWC